MAGRITTLSKLLAPTRPEDFLANSFGRKVAHIRGTSKKFASVMSWDVLNRILAMDVWSAKSMQLMMDAQRVPLSAYCIRTVNRNGHPTDRPDAARVQQLVQRGASLLLNEIETLHEGVLAVVRCLEQAFGAKGSANLYCSWQARPAFDSHFDRHDVYALQVVGDKRWRIYQGRAENPIEHALFHNVPQAEYDRMKGQVAREVDMRPGDLLYLPRGQFHDALASSAASIHVTFAVSQPTGIDWLLGIWEEAVRDSLFRADLPLPGDEAGLAAHIERLTRRFGELALEPAALQRAKLARDEFGIKRGTFDLPKRAK